MERLDPPLSLSFFNEDLLYCILEHSDLSSFVSFCSTAKRLIDIAYNSNELWKKLIYRDFGFMPASKQPKPDRMYHQYKEIFLNSYNLCLSSDQRSNSNSYSAKLFVDIGAGVPKHKNPFPPNKFLPGMLVLIFFF